MRNKNLKRTHNLIFKLSLGHKQFIRTKLEQIITNNYSSKQLFF